MKRILIFSLAYTPFVGGAELAIKEITDRISDIEFDMVTLRFDRSLPRVEKIGNVTVYRLGFGKASPMMADLVKFPLALNKYLFPFLAFLKASRLHRKNNYSAVWAMMANYAGFATLFFKMAHPDVPFLLTLQEGDPIEYIKARVKFVYPLFKRIFIRADFMQVISHYLGNWARDMNFAGPLEVIPNGVAIAHFTKEYPVNELDALKAKLGKKTGDVWLITTSRLVKKNAVDDVIKALPLLPEKVAFLVLGTGPDEVMLTNLVQELGVEKRVLFAGQVGHADMPKYLRISDIFIRPSLSEGMGNSFVEAMAVGLPVIATPVGGIVDFLKDRETGLFCEVRNPRSIADAVLKLCTDESLKNTLVRNARELVQEKYDWDIVAKDMREKVFEKML